MLDRLLKYIVFACSLLLHNSDAFWWRAATTTESPSVLKQVPLTYFRTYTYQPLPGNPYAFPFFGAAAPPPQTPLMTGARYDHYAGHYPSVLPLPETLQLLKAPTTTSTTAAPTAPSTTSTTTTTTTTTTPAPTTSSSTTASTTSTAVNRQHSVGPLINPTVAFSAYPSASYNNPEFPNYNRRIFNTGYGSNNYRPPYPYPEYYTYNNQGLKGASPFSFGSRGSQIQFVPCLCPVNMGGGNGATASGTPSAPGSLSFGEQSNGAFYTQSRSTADDEKDMELPTETVLPTKAKVFIEPEAEAALVSKSEVISEEQHSSLTNKIDDELLQATSSEESSAHSEEI